MILNVEGRNDTAVEETNEHIRFLSVGLFENVLKEFGHSIRNLMIENTVKVENPQLLNATYKLIEKYCSDTLVQLHLNWAGPCFLDEIEKPFKKVVNVTWELNSHEVFNLRDLFPAMRSLCVKYDDPLRIPLNTPLKFPQMEHLSINYTNKNPDFHKTEPLVIQFMKENPQIRQLSMNQLSPRLLECVAKRLPNLEKLELCEYRHDEEFGVHHFDFTQLKSFKFGYYLGYYWPRYINFSDNLEEFESASFPYDTHYSDFIVNNKNLKILRIFGGLGASNKHVQLLASAHLNIEEMILDCNYDIKADSIVQLIKNTTRLNEIQLTMNTTPFTIAETIAKLKLAFRKTWAMKFFNKSIFLRKKN